MSLCWLTLPISGCDGDTADDDDTGATDDDATDDDDSQTDDDDDDSQTDDDDSQTDDDDDSQPVEGAIVADHTAAADFDFIPTSYFDQVRADYTFFYGHTSHGSQIMTGIDTLQDEDGTLYEVPSFHEISDDLGSTGDTSWMQPTRDALDTGSYNVAMWSWCGGVSGNTEQGIQTYLDSMQQLQNEYPGVLFIYMTGHLDGSGENGSLRTNNRQIRQWCLDHDKVLFDFEDIESWDPDGTYYPDDTDYCNWCTAWCDSHSCPTCTGDCAHSQCFNCYSKGRAWWWMMARVAGWTG